MNEKDFCIHCGSKKIAKAGKTTSTKGYWKQKYKCQNCKSKFTGNKIHPIIEEKFVYQNKELSPRNWGAINEAQINEKQMFMDLATELLDLIIIENKTKTGRPTKNIKDILFCMLLKTYTRLPSRRLMTDLKLAKQQDYISNVPCFSTLMNYYNNQRLQPLLTTLIELSAIPLASKDETTIAIDSSGFGVSRFSRWYDHKWNQEKEKRTYRKCHLTIGVKSNIVTAVMLSNQHENDSPFLKPLLKRTAINFHIKRFLADKAYLSSSNLQAIKDLGAEPIIPFKSNSTMGKGKNGKIWSKMYRYFNNNPQEFFRKYHLRSNIECCFNQIKTRFGDSLMTKNIDANFCEILCKVLAHNIVVLIRAYYEFDTEIRFSTENPNMQLIKA